MARSLQFFEPSEISTNSEIISMFVYVLNSFFNYRFCFNLPPLEVASKKDKDERNEKNLDEINKSDENIKNEGIKIELNLNEISDDNDKKSFHNRKRSRASRKVNLEDEEGPKRKKTSNDSIGSSEDNSEEADMVVDLHNFGSRSMSFEKKEVKKNMILKRMSQIYEVKWNDEANLSKIIDWSQVWLKEWLQKVIKNTNIKSDEGVVEKSCGLLVFDMNLLEKKMDEEVNSDEYSPGFVMVSSKNIATIERVIVFLLF